MRVAIYQADIVWGDAKTNCKSVETLLNSISSQCDLLVLPEMFNTGFSMSPETVYGTMGGKSLKKIK